MGIRVILEAHGVDVLLKYKGIVMENVKLMSQLHQALKTLESANLSATERKILKTALTSASDQCHQSLCGRTVTLENETVELFRAPKANFTQRLPRQIYPIG